MPRTPRNAGTTSQDPETTAVARDVIASLDHDPELYVPGTLGALPGRRTVMWRTACSTRCPHRDGRCHRSHAVWVDDDRTHALLAGEPAAEHARHAEHARAAGPRVPAQRRVSERS